LDTPVGDSFYDLIRPPEHRRRDRQPRGPWRPWPPCWLRTATIFRKPSILRNVIWRE